MPPGLGAGRTRCPPESSVCHQHGVRSGLPLIPSRRSGCQTAVRVRDDSTIVEWDIRRANLGRVLLIAKRYLLGRGHIRDASLDWDHLNTPKLQAGEFHVIGLAIKHQIIRFANQIERDRHFNLRNSVGAELIFA